MNYFLLPVLAMCVLPQLPILSRASALRTGHLNSVPTCKDAQLFQRKNMKTPRVPEGSNASFQISKLAGDDQTPVMLKIIPGESLTDSKLIRTISILQLLNQEYETAPFFYGACATESDVYFVMEFLEGDDLHQQLEAQETFPEHQTKETISEILRIVSNLHRQNMIHRDIKLENFMFAYLDNSGLRIIDFDDARLVDNEGRMLTPYVGSQVYRAPEIDSGLRIYDTKADIYSIGLLFLEMVLGNRGNKENVSEASLENLDARTRDFVEKMVSEEVEERWSADELLKHPYLKKIEQKERSTLQKVCEMCHVTRLFSRTQRKSSRLRTDSI